MNKITEKDLQYKDYNKTCTIGDNPKKIKIDKEFLNRKEDYEVVYFINELAPKIITEQGILGRKLKDSEVCKEIERMIHDELPGDIRSHKKVEEWIRKNWKN